MQEESTTSAIATYFMETIPFIEGNKKLRSPQIQAYLRIKEYFSSNPSGEALVVLPTGTGKSTLIAIAPYGTTKGRVLVITPGLVTKKSVIDNLLLSKNNTWVDYDIFLDPEHIPVGTEYDKNMLQKSLLDSNFVITNVHKLASSTYRDSLVDRVPPDFFDMIIIDEAHHSVANTWQFVLNYFKKAKKLHLTGTPFRGDGQTLPGELIHETSLAEVMRMKYIKGLRNKPLNHCNLFFTMPGSDQKLSVEEVKNFRDEEWVQKSIALSKECTIGVIQESIKELDELKKLSSNVPHKVLAVACSIAHAEEVAEYYRKEGKRTVIIHSENEDNDDAFLAVENHQCDVVVSVNMLMEGYDHKYLTILAIFRPYKSLNAFAQVVGRILRAIPDNEIINHDIDNNALIIYHEELGLNTLWEYFKKETNKSKMRVYNGSDNDPISRTEYERRKEVFAEIEAGQIQVSEELSFSDEIDYNLKFELAKKEIEENLNQKRELLKEIGLSSEAIEVALEKEASTLKASKSKEIDKLLVSKNPELARNEYRKLLRTTIQDRVAEILTARGIDEKGNELYSKFKDHIYTIVPNMQNDGILVNYVNTQLLNKIGKKVSERSLDELKLSLNLIENILNQLEKML